MNSLTFPQGKTLILDLPDERLQITVWYHTKLYCVATRLSANGVDLYSTVLPAPQYDHVDHYVYLAVVELLKEPLLAAYHEQLRRSFEYVYGQEL